MNTAVKAQLQQNGLQVTPFTLTKVIQLYETKNSRHSSMLVGKTGSGKSVTWRILQKALTALHQGGDKNYNIVQVSSGAGGPGVEKNKLSLQPLSPVVSGLSPQPQGHESGRAVWRV